MIDCAVHLRWQDRKKVWHQTDLYRQGGNTEMLDPPQGARPIHLKFEPVEGGFILRLYLSPDEPMRLETLWIEIPYRIASHARVLVNGFQSWSENGIWRMDEGRNSLNPYAGPLMRYHGLDGFGDYRFVAYDDDAGEFHSHLFAAIQQTEKGHALDSAESVDFFASIEEDLAYGIFRFREDAVVLQREVEGLVVLPGGRMASTVSDLEAEYGRGMLPQAFFPDPADGLCVAALYAFRGPLFEGVSAWKRSIGGTMPDDGTAIDLGTARTGWTSWYLDYVSISQPLIEARLSAYEALGVAPRYAQTDDGYQSRIGDWEATHAAFGGTTRDIASAVRSKNREPGIWIAPFLAHRSSRLYKEHKDWLVRPEDHDSWLKDPLVSGLGDTARAPASNFAKRRKAVARIPLWKGAVYALDILNPDLRSHLASVFEHLIRGDGFSMIKADFLFAAGLEPRRGLGRAALTSLALSFLRLWTAGTLLLTCGVPIGPALTRSGACRIGCDVGAWDDKRLAAIRFQERISTRNAIRSAAMRVLLAREDFLIDPDVTVLRSHDTFLTEEERQSLWLTNQCLGQLLFTSDDPARWTEGQKKTYLSQFPLRPRTLTRWIADGTSLTADIRLGPLEQSYRLVVNWGNQPVHHPVYDGHDLRAQWWIATGTKIEDTLWKVVNGLSYAIPPHGAMLFSRLPVEPVGNTCIVVGDTGHVFPGGGIENIGISPFAEDGVPGTGKGPSRIDITYHKEAHREEGLTLALPVHEIDQGMTGWVDLGIRIGTWAFIREIKDNTHG